MKAKLRASDFKRLVEGTKKFISKNDINKLMNYIYLEVDAEKKEVKATALDGRRVSFEYAHVLDVDESFSCYIRPNIPKITKYDLNAELELVDKKAYVTVGESITGYVQPEGQYFNTDKMLMDDLNKTTVVAAVGVDVSLLKDALDSIPKGYKPYVKIELRQPHQPIVITPTKEGEKQNQKIVLPVHLRTDDI